MPRGGESGNETRDGGKTTQAGRPDLDVQIAFAKEAERLGIHGLLVDIGASNPDPLLLGAAVGLATEKIELIVACRSGLWPPTTFAQQLNTLSALVEGRVSVNVVAGHSPKEQQFYGDFLAHDERYARTEEFLHVCNALWHDEGPVSFEGKYYRIVDATLSAKFESPDRRAPVLFIAGGSDQAHDVTISEGTCWMRMADRPEAVADSSVAVRAAGKQVGLRLCVICRPTTEQALQAASDLIGGLDPSRDECGKEAQFVGESDSVSVRTTFALAAEQWLTPTLWTGTVRTHGAPTMSLVGTPREVADAVLEYGRNGVSHFILSGWPKLEEMRIFGEEVIPLVRAAES